MRECNPKKCGCDPEKDKYYLWCNDHLTIGATFCFMVGILIGLICGWLL